MTRPAAIQLCLVSPAMRETTDPLSYTANRRFALLQQLVGVLKSEDSDKMFCESVGGTVL